MSFWQQDPDKGEAFLLIFLLLFWLFWLIAGIPLSLMISK